MSWVECADKSCVFNDHESNSVPTCYVAEVGLDVIPGELCPKTLGWTIKDVRSMCDMHSFGVEDETAIDCEIFDITKCADFELHRCPLFEINDQRILVVKLYSAPNV